MRCPLRILGVVLVFALSSCVFPTHIADEQPYTEASLDFIAMNETTRADVRTELGDPVRVFSDGQYWLYQSDRKMTEWFVFFASPGGAGGAELGGDERLYSLIVGFGSDDTVNTLTVVTDKSKCSPDKSLCYSNGELTVAPKSGGAAHTFADQSPNAHLADKHLRALRDDEEYPFIALTENEERIELIERGGLVFDAKSMEPLTARISLADERGVRRVFQRYREGKLDGPMIVSDEDGKVVIELCLENGEVVLTPIDECGH